MATVTSKGRELSVNLWNTTGSIPKNIGWGGGNYADAVSDVAMFGELPEARTVGAVTITTTTTPNDTFTVTGTVTATGARTVTEGCLSDSATKPTGTDAVVTASGVIASSSGTTVIVTTGASFAVNEYIQIRTEVMKITSIASNTLTVTRGQNGSAAISTIAVADVVTRGNIPGVTLVTNGNLFAHFQHGSTTLATGEQITYTVAVKQT